MSELNVGNLNVGSELNLPLYPESGLPQSPPTGHMVFNTTKGKIVVWDGTNWVAIGSSKYEINPGGSNYTVSNLTGDFAGYKVIKFTGSGSFTITNSPDDQGVEFLLIAGGGGGGGVIGGGGGAGGVIYKRNVNLPAGTYTVNIGDGGLGGIGWNNANQEGQAGTPSTISGGNVFYEAIGGGGGSGHGGSSPASYAGKGGSGGGSAAVARYGGGATGVLAGNLSLHLKNDYAMNTSGSRRSEVNQTVVGTYSQVQINVDHVISGEKSQYSVGPAEQQGWQGHPGGDWGDGNHGAGGGGAGQSGQNAGVPDNKGGNGGHGIYCEIEGSKVSYAGGGAGGVRGTTRSGGAGGVGGGGKGGQNSVSRTPYAAPAGAAAQDGKPNTGGGGGGGGYNGGSSAEIGARGGSGVFIIRYKAS